MRYKTLGNLGQWLSLIASCVGLVLMIYNNVIIWHDFIVSGALLLTISTKVRYYGGNWMAKRRRIHLHTVEQLVQYDKFRKKAIK